MRRNEPVAVNAEKWYKRTVRLVRADYESLQRLAERNHRSADGELRIAVEEHLRRHAQAQWNELGRELGLDEEPITG